MSLWIVTSVGIGCACIARTAVLLTDTIEIQYTVLLYASSASLGLQVLFFLGYTVANWKEPTSE